MALTQAFGGLWLEVVTVEERAPTRSFRANFSVEGRGSIVWHYFTLLLNYFIYFIFVYFFLFFVYFFWIFGLVLFFVFSHD